MAQVTNERLAELIAWDGYYLSQHALDLVVALRELQQARAKLAGVEAIPMILFCPACSFSHIDEGEWATKSHKTHLCVRCGFTWRPCAKPTVGVASIDEFGAIDLTLSAADSTGDKHD